MLAFLEAAVRFGATPAKLPALISALGPDFDVDPEALETAARRRASWNLFYLPAFTKLDLFFLRNGPSVGFGMQAALRNGNGETWC